MLQDTRLHYGILCKVTTEEYTYMQWSIARVEVADTTTNALCPEFLLFIQNSKVHGKKTLCTNAVLVITEKKKKESMYYQQTLFLVL